MPFPTDYLARLGDVSVPLALPPVARMRDNELLNAQRALAEVQRRLSAVSAAVAGEIAHRSRRELGHSGLAQTHGQRTAEGLISQLTGGSTRDARTLVKAGELLPTESPRPDVAPTPEWLAVIGAAVGSAAISVEAAGVIRARLESVSQPDARATAEQQAAFWAALNDATRRLIADAPQLTLDELTIRASRARDELDLAGVAAREHEQHQRRFLRFTPQPDGMVRVNGLLDRESAAIIVPVVDAITSPRRSGPRFTDPTSAADADSADLVRDERTPDQLVVDTFVELIRAGARVNPNRILGDRKPGVRILVTHRDLHATPDADGHRPGVAYFEGHTEPVSIATAERYICSTGAVPILFDDDTGRVLNLGREQRLFSEKQRLALAARDGGCLMCHRPPSWAEAHHINHWDAHHGRTDIDDGVLLCRFCHLLIHNRRWRITRHGGDYTLERTDPDGTTHTTPLPTRNPTHHRLQAS